MQKRILITGGCGFLGQYLINDLLNKFKNVYIKVLDLRPNNNPIFNFSGNSNVEILLNKDICNYGSIKDDFKDINMVIHLAGIVSFSLKDKELLERVNVNGTKNIIKAVIENKISDFIHISSVAALGYNDNKDKPMNESFKFDWSIAKNKKKYYMLTKHLADVEIEKTKKLNAIILYPGLMFGPGDTTNSAKLINAIKNKKIPFNMPGGTNIIDVRDVSSGIIKVIEKNLKKSNYLLSGNNLTFSEVNKIIADEVDVTPPKMTLPKFLNPILFRIMLFVEMLFKNKIELTADNVDSAFKFRYFDNSKAKESMGWRPDINFIDTIKNTVKWMNSK